MLPFGLFYSLNSVFVALRPLKPMPSKKHSIKLNFRLVLTKTPSTDKIRTTDALTDPEAYGWSTSRGNPDTVMYSTRYFSTGPSGPVQVARKDSWVTSDVTRSVGEPGPSSVQKKTKTRKMSVLLKKKSLFMLTTYLLLCYLTFLIKKHKKKQLYKWAAIQF